MARLVTSCTFLQKFNVFNTYTNRFCIYFIANSVSPLSEVECNCRVFHVPLCAICELALQLRCNLMGNYLFKTFGICLWTFGHTNKQVFVNIPGVYNLSGMLTWNIDLHQHIVDLHRYIVDLHRYIVDLHRYIVYSYMMLYQMQYINHCMQYC